MGDPTSERGGRRKRLYRLEPGGLEALDEAVRIFRAMSKGLRWADSTVGSKRPRKPRSGRDRPPSPGKIGAYPGSIYALVLKQGLGIAVVGLLLGLAGSMGLVRLLERYLYEVAPLDPTAFVVASFALVAATLLAVLKPARRAASVDVVECLKAE